MTGVSRRHLLVGAAIGAGAAGLGVPLLTGLAGSSSTGTLLRSRRPLPRPFSRRLTIPAELAPVRREGEADVYEIEQRVGRADILDGVGTPIWGYNGTFPGPTIRSRSGRPVVVYHRNALPVPTVVHLHGGHTPAEHDGYPTDLLLPEGSAGQHPAGHGGAVTVGRRGYAYPMNQPAATLWYHDHRMDFTGPAVWRGLAGFHLVGDAEEEALPLPRGQRDLPLMIADRAFDQDGTLRYPSRSDDLLGSPGVHPPYQAGVLGDVILVNGQPWPTAEVAGTHYRLRLLNASNARRYRLRLDPAPPGALVQIGSDGGLLPGPVRHDSIDLAPAERVDVVVDFARWRPGQHVTLVNDFGEDAGTGRVMRFEVGDAVADPARVPARLSADHRTLRRADATRTRSLVFQSRDTGGAHHWLINGRPFHPERVDVAPRLGSVEIWRLVGDLHHPIHLHLSHFQVLSRGTGGPRGTDAGWKDTLDLLPGEPAEIIVPFADYPGRYVFHCHNLEHEDMMMMGNLTVG
ncbi:multicopper oxidase family protein [Plantactinospora mayteni]|uniref:Spore coat protein A n=1 Tax=Plantactinospora mayteni TaxID=566021 RepID=A0ABQ4EIZ3_9ACTN|nr:multicopper oxidase family protein [Plantactinospora mayteni]GIG94680.1 spore coat protein A [Plantactinospora mayteni]